MKWRLPTIEESLALIDFESKDLKDNVVMAKDTPYWTATTYIYSKNYAWCISFENGKIMQNHKTIIHSVRPVRTLDDGSIEWYPEETSDGMNWEDAVKWCNSLNPTFSEFSGICLNCKYRAEASIVKTFEGSLTTFKCSKGMNMLKQSCPKKEARNDF